MFVEEVGADREVDLVGPHGAQLVEREHGDVGVEVAPVIHAQEDAALARRIEQPFDVVDVDSPADRVAYPGLVETG
jgi:hypothetical protein